MSMPRAAATLAVALAALSLPARLFAGECDPARYYEVINPLTTGPNPYHPVLADFNEDGHLDVVLTHSDSQLSGNGDVTILLGNGNGGFGAPAVMPLNGQPHFVAVGDFNGDDILDLAVTRKTSGTVQVYLGNGLAGVGNGTFSVLGPYLTGGAPFQIVAGDYDEDGDLDLAIALNNIARVSVMRGNGDGSFAPPVFYPIANLGVGIVQGDFDNDGILDLVATGYVSGAVSFLKGLGTAGVGDGTFAAAQNHPAGPEPWDLDVFDYDADGKLDLLVGNSASGGTRVLRGNGSGGFSIVASLVTGNTSCVLAADVDGDGVLDILASESVLPVGRILRVFHGNGSGGIGDGTWSLQATVSLVDPPYQIALGDLDEDGHPDAVVSGYTSNRLSILPWGCREFVPDPRRPVLTRVRDVPADQGGRVYLTWLRSSLDVSGGSVNAYRVWRQIPEEQAAEAALASEAPRATRHERAPDGTVLTTFWEAIATLPAQRLEGYGYTAETTEDSTAANPVQASFFITALTSNLDVFYDSEVVSGASVDNLAPAPPANLRLESTSPGAVVVAWSPNLEPDFATYRIERSLVKTFPPEETTVVEGTQDTTLVDAAQPAAAYYRVAAFDVHGNPSPFTPTLVVGGVAAGETPAVLSLLGARPNPVRGGDVTLHFSLAGTGRAALELYDVRGRRVAAPSLEGLRAGPHALRLDGRLELAPGVYVVRLVEGSRSIERKLTIAR